jgi:ABC-2 type transport system ATP-binding protein
MEKDDRKKIIDVEKVTKKFKNFTAVDSVSFFVKEGETFAFLGPNGAGKTTTIKMLTTLLHQTSGDIKINGFSTIHQKDRVRCSFGIVFQDPSLDDDLTALENMEFHAELYGVKKSLRKKRIFELMNLVELWDRRKDYVKTFSGGMKRRLEIARGLIHHPKIFFLDEPTIGLDPQTRNFMWKYIEKMSKSEKTTIFLTTHYIEEAEKVADRVAIIDNGKIIQIGTPNELKKATKSESLEGAFLKLTGHSIREESASAKDRMRIRHNAMGRR